MYGRGLEKHFDVEFSPALHQEGPHQEEPSPHQEEIVADAVVYDIPQREDALGLERFAAVDVPVVVLTLDDGLPIPALKKCSVLTYPVRVSHVVDALRRLGVESD